MSPVFTDKRWARMPEFIKELIAYKAEDCDESVEEYLKDTDGNYVILTNSVMNPFPCYSGRLFDYVVYGSEEEARLDFEEQVDLAIIPESAAIIYLAGLCNLNEIK